ncbi:MAG: outer membrane lipoprotein carrier protein LolA [Pseudomonadota bacterium]
MTACVLSRARALVLFAMVGALALAGSAAAAPHTKEKRELLDRVSSYFNSITTLSGAFIQQDSYGSAARGNFYFKRPGKMRFEYTNPPNLTIIADGLWYIVNDTALQTADRYPLRSTPIHVFLKKDVDLANDKRITGVEEAPGEIIVRAEDDAGLVQGSLEMVFASPAIELLRWTITDAQGITTTVALSNVVPGGDLKASLFVPVEKSEDER